MCWDGNWNPFAEMWGEIGRRIIYEAKCKREEKTKCQTASDQRLYTQVQSIGQTERIRELDLLKIVEECLK